VDRVFVPDLAVIMVGVMHNLCRIHIVVTIIPLYVCESSLDGLEETLIES